MKNLEQVRARLLHLIADEKGKFYQMANYGEKEKITKIGDKEVLIGYDQNTIFEACGVWNDLVILRHGNKTIAIRKIDADKLRLAYPQGVGIKGIKSKESVHEQR